MLTYIIWNPPLSPAAIATKKHKTNIAGLSSVINYPLHLMLQKLLEVDYNYNIETHLNHKRSKALSVTYSGRTSNNIFHESAPKVAM